MTHLPIRISLVARPVSTDKTVKLPHYISAAVDFFGGALGIEDAEETVRASRDASAVLNFYAAPIGSTFKGSRQLAAEGLN